MTELETVHADPTLRIITSRNVQVNLWSNAPDLEQMRLFARASVAHGRRFPRGTGLLNLIVGGTPSFTEPVRAEVIKVMMQPELFSLGSAHVILLGGFSGTAARAFMSTVILLARPRRPNKVFGEAEPAIAWLAPLLAGGAEPWSPAALDALVTQSLAL
jgi:hypothetical protein